MKKYQMNMIDDKTLVYIDGSDVVKGYGKDKEYDKLIIHSSGYIVSDIRI